MENGLDNLLVPSLRNSIEENLGKETLRKIEETLWEVKRKQAIGMISTNNP